MGGKLLKQTFRTGIVLLKMTLSSPPMRFATLEPAFSVSHGVLSSYSSVGATAGVDKKKVGGHQVP